MNTIYLDHAAATALDARVLLAMQPYFADKFYNPSALYAAARQVREDIDAARSKVAHYFGARPAEIVFTAGCTEANNLAIHGVMDGLLGQFPDSRLLMSAVEHDSVLETGKHYNYGLIPVSEQGIVNVVALDAQIDDQTVLVSVMYANNEIGTIQPIRDIGRLIARVRKDRQLRGISAPIYFHSDAAQAGNYLDLHTARLGIDLLSINGGKIYGPKQTGALYIRAGTLLSPLVRGGGQELGLRSGTENVSGIIGLATSLELAQDARHDEAKRLADFQQYFFAELASGLPEAIVNGSLKKRLPNNLHFTLPGQDNERLLYLLDAAGIQAAAGSACSASNDTPSHVLRAIGLSDSEARASLRLTMGRTTTKADLDRVVAALRDISMAPSSGS